LETTCCSSKGSNDCNGPVMFSLGSPRSVRRENLKPLPFLFLGSGKVIRCERCSRSSSTLQLMSLNAPSGLHQDQARQTSRAIRSRLAKGSAAMIWRISSMSSDLSDWPQMVSGKSARALPPAGHAVLPDNLVRNVPG